VDELAMSIMEPPPVNIFIPAKVRTFAASLLATGMKILNL
jgi:hypothetical protein